MTNAFPEALLPRAGLVNFTCQGPDSEYFRLPGPYSLVNKFSTLPS